MDLTSTITWVISAVFSISIIFIAIVIVLENRNPSKTVTWLTVLYLLPVVGFVFYIFFGRNFRKKRRVKQKEMIKPIGDVNAIIDTQKQILKDKETFLDEKYYSKKRIMKLLLQSNQSPFTTNNRAKVLTNGFEKFSAVFKAIDKATDHIHVEYFIIRNDRIGHAFKQKLLKKAKEGVKVRVIYDGVGSWKVDFQPKFFKELKEAGGEVHCFVPIRVPFLNSRMNYRNHRKIIVVDGKVGFVGGINISDNYLGKGKVFSFWRDTHLQLEGDAVYFLQKIFINDWHFVSNENLNADRYFPTHTFGGSGEQLVQIAASGPDSEWDTIMQLYYLTMATAQDSIHITSPYFIPDDSIIMALKTAALSGVDVRIIIPDVPDYYIVYWATQSYLEELLEAGVKIYQYQKGFIHAKLLIVDGVIASIGSANMDIRSFQLNYEVNALIYNEETVKRLEADFQQDLKECRLITYEEFIKRPLTNKIKESGARLLSPLL
ncbi:cardiolipin synthase [Desulfuribacillus alkaliarsenatis]|uniref:Cardiolipin synthase n=1 Tax=Desulfuribacillus alkaliarsenatis TaxID=766136 RepID=A0A1E5G0R8_9FIRM|nr:cardiolipin synthase [Desulfuribacillus alkaliarsenatis]OEF96507.1 cardiolipin synthase [Desulfuribacillus alkaliarsenatis]